MWPKISSMQKSQIQRYLFLVVASLILSSCASIDSAINSTTNFLKTKVDPKTEFTTENGFRFKFAMAGEWIPNPPVKQQYSVRQALSSRSTTRGAVVIFGPIQQPQDKKLSPAEALEEIRKDMEKDSQGGRVHSVQSRFENKKYQGADCFFFEQEGVDPGPDGELYLKTDGLVCLHPKEPDQFVWMGLSERHPKDSPLSPSWEEDKNVFLKSLEFVDKPKPSKTLFF